MILSALMIASCTNNTQENNPDLASKIEAVDTKPASSVVDNTAVLIGDDFNGNGIRDYIETAIDALAITDNQKDAVKFSAKALQNTILIDISDDAALKASSEQLMASIGCMSLRFADYEDNESLFFSLEDETFDTEARKEAYNRYNIAQSGATATLPTGNPCDGV